jgi:hypothetical protein
MIGQHILPWDPSLSTLDSIGLIMKGIDKCQLWILGTTLVHPQNQLDHSSKGFFFSLTIKVEFKTITNKITFNNSPGTQLAL